MISSTTKYFLLSESREHGYENMVHAFKKLKPHIHHLHSDQGWQYRMRRYQNILKEQGLHEQIQKRQLFDNAV
jgi:putative transposase